MRSMKKFEHSSNFVNNLCVDTSDIAKTSLELIKRIKQDNDAHKKVASKQLGIMLGDFCIDLSLSLKHKGNAKALLNTWLTISALYRSLNFSTAKQLNSNQLYIVDLWKVMSMQVSGCINKIGY